MKLFFKYIISLLLLLCVSQNAICEDKPSNEKKKTRWEEYMDDKKAFLVKEVNLSEDDQNVLFPVYEKMSREKYELQRQIKDKKKSLRKFKEEDRTDQMYIDVVELQMSVTLKEAEIEKTYFAQFRKFLSAKQLYKLQCAEQKFTREMMKKSFEKKLRDAEKKKKEAEKKNTEKNRKK